MSDSGSPSYRKHQIKVSTDSNMNEPTYKRGNTKVNAETDQWLFCLFTKWQSLKLNVDDQSDRVEESGRKLTDKVKCSNVLNTSMTVK